MHYLRLLAAWLILGGLLQPLAAASPRDELLRYVPDDVGFCLVAQNVRVQLRQYLQSPFHREFPHSAPGKALLASDEWRQLQQAREYLEKHLGFTLDQLIDDVLGDTIIFAYRPGPPNDPDQEQGMILIRARNEKTLADLVSKINALQKSTRELESLEDRTHKGVKYVRRKEVDTTNYYHLQGPTLIFSGQEELIQQAIDRQRECTGVPPLARRFQKLELDQAVVGLFINPRAWDEEMAVKQDSPAARMALRIWKALQGVGLGLYVERDVRLSLSVEMKTEELPESARRFLTTAAGAGELLGGFDESALLSFNGRFDLFAAYEFLGECLPAKMREAMEADLERTLGAVVGRDVIKELLPAIGPDWSVSILPPAAESKSWTPRMLAAIRVARGDENDPVDESILSAVQSWAQLLVLTHNKQNPERMLRLRSTLVEGTRVRYFSGEGVFPPGMQPAFALKSGHLLFAGAPTELARFKLTPPREGTPLLSLSLKQWRAFLAARRESIASWFPQMDKKGRNVTLDRIDELLSVLSYFDRLDLRQRGEAGQATFTLTFTPGAPLRK